MPHRLNYVAALPCKMYSAHRARETALNFCAKKHQSDQNIPPDLWHPNIPNLNRVDYKSWVIIQRRVYQTKISSVDERRVIDDWCGLGQSTIAWIVDYRLSPGGAFPHQQTATVLQVLLIKAREAASVQLIIRTFRDG